MKAILVVSEQQQTIDIIRTCFLWSYRIDRAANRETALSLIKKKRHDFIFIDLKLLMAGATDNNYHAALQPFWLNVATVEIIVMASQEAIREAVKAVKAGASNYLTYPLNTDEIKYVTESIKESNLVRSELNYLRDQFWQTDSLKVVQTKSQSMQKVFEKIRSVAPTISTVLLMGETGTGKGVMATLIHKHSNRKDSQFISVHCGAIPDTLIESELFGHEKGAFTGATRRKLGKFEIAKDGTIFLDEISTITPAAQIKLLQILQEKTFSRVGGEETIDANVRIIAATNNNLEKLCDDGLFRKDLFYRLNVFPIEIPPLRERPEDIPLLVEVFLERLNKFHTKDIHDVHPEVMEVLENYEWPGNIRELENLLERAYILETSSILTKESFPSELFTAQDYHPLVQFDPSLNLAEVRRRGIEQIEQYYLKELLSTNQGKIAQSANAAGITTRQLHKLMKKHGLRKEEFKFSD